VLGENDLAYGSIHSCEGRRIVSTLAWEMLSIQPDIWKLGLP
jgi:hypothetical protein